jgi:hypothetical protein
VRAWLGVAAVAVLAAGCGAKHVATTNESLPPPPRTGPAPWPAPSAPLALARKAGLEPEPHEFFAFHVHAHLDVFVAGKRVRVPAGIGIEIEDPAVKRFPAPDGTTEYGGISPPCNDPCISPLHTHDDTGVLHTESARTHPNGLGQFFTEWDVRLDRRCIGGYCGHVAVYVDGSRYRGDPRKITLTDMKEIAIVVGSPPDSIPGKFPS